MVNKLHCLVDIILIVSFFGFAVCCPPFPSQTPLLSSLDSFLLLLKFFCWIKCKPFFLLKKKKKIKGDVPVQEMVFGGVWLGQLPFLQFVILFFPGKIFFF